MQRSSGPFLEACMQKGINEVIIATKLAKKMNKPHFMRESIGRNN
jgi:hypothetical protein